VAGRRTHAAAGVGAQRHVAQPVGHGGGRARGRTAGDAIRRRAVDRRAEMRVLPVHRKRQLVGDGLADEARAGVQQFLHGGRRACLDARQRQHEGLAAAGGVAGHVEQVLHREAQAGQRPGGRLWHRYFRVGHEGAGGVVDQGHVGSRFWGSRRLRFGLAPAGASDVQGEQLNAARSRRRVSCIGRVKAQQVARSARPRADRHADLSCSGRFSDEGPPSAVLPRGTEPPAPGARLRAGRRVRRRS